jgi:hypothetical protein
MSEHPFTLHGKRIAFIGRLGAMTRKEACEWFKGYGATAYERWPSEFDLVVIGADELPDEEIKMTISLLVIIFLACLVRISSKEISFDIAEINSLLLTKLKTLG